MNVENHSEKAKKIRCNVMKRRSTIEKLPAEEKEKIKEIVKEIASKRAKVEHVYATMKNIFKWKYTRVRGIKNNSAKFYMLCTFVNIYKLSRKIKKTLLVQRDSCV